MSNLTISKYTIKTDFSRHSAILFHKIPELYGKNANFEFCIVPGKRKTLFQTAFLNSNKNGKKTAKNAFFSLKKTGFSSYKTHKKTVSNKY